MKGVHLGRVSRAQPGQPLPIPLDGVRLETLCLRAPLEEAPEAERFYLALEGEVVLDLARDFVHLRRGEGVAVPGGATRRLSPVGEAVVLIVHRGER